MPQITVVSMIVECRLSSPPAFPLLYPLGLMESGSLFAHFHVHVETFCLFLNILQELNLSLLVHFGSCSCSLGTFWFLDLLGMGPHFQEHCSWSLGTFLVPKKLLEAIYRIMWNTADIIKSKVVNSKWHCHFSALCNNISEPLSLCICRIQLSYYCSERDEFAQNVYFAFIICVLKFDLHNTNKSWVNLNEIFCVSQHQLCSFSETNVIWPEDLLSIQQQQIPIW